MTRVSRAFRQPSVRRRVRPVRHLGGTLRRVRQATPKAVRAIVEAQLAAFAADDAKRAFSYAAPAIREMFGTPDRFMEMVRAGYPVVYRPASVVFLNPEWVEGQLVQGVHLTDASGGLWLAVLYQNSERQPDKSWRISGCSAQPRPRARWA